MSETPNPLVTVIVRTKDRPKLLRRALQSIADQDYRPVEVLLVNDGEAFAEAASLQGMMGDVEVRHLDNGGRGRTAAANLGLRNAGGRYVCFLDDDDIFYADHVSTHVSFLEQSDYRVSYTGSWFVHREYDAERREIVEARRYPAETMDFSADTLLFYNYIPFMCLTFDRDVLTRAGGFDEDFDLCEDWDLTVRISRSHPFYHIKKMTSEYTIWSSDFQSIRKNERISEYRRRIYRKHLAEFTPALIATFIFNGYWINTKQLEDRISACETELKRREEEYRDGTARVLSEKQKLEKELVSAREELSALRDDLSALRDDLGTVRDDLGRSEAERNRLTGVIAGLSAEKERVTGNLIRLEEHVRSSTVKVPRRLKSFLKTLLMK